jgi:hypothetical protein
MQALLARAQTIAPVETKKKTKKKTKKNGSVRGGATTHNGLDVAQTFEALTAPNRLLGPALARYAAATGQVRTK